MYDLNHISPLNLSESVIWIREHANQNYTEKELLKLAYGKSEDALLPMYAVSHDFVMTAAFEHDANFAHGSKTIKRLTETERKTAYRSYARGEVFRLHPSFIEKLATILYMRINDCAIHTLTVAYSPSKLPGWKRLNDEGTKLKSWTKTFDSCITPTDDILGIALSDIRINQTDLETRFIDSVDLQPNVIIKDVSLPKETSLVEVTEPSSWVVKVQVEAAERMLRLRKSGANPTKNSILEDLAKWCVRNNVCTKTGINPSTETIRKHALRKWTPPS